MGNALRVDQLESTTEAYSGFGLNSVLFPNENEGVCQIKDPHIVIYADASTDRVFALNLKKTRKPERMGYKDLLVDLDRRIIKSGSLHIPPHMLLPDAQFTENSLLKRDQKFRVIEPVLNDLEAFLVSRSYGRNLINKAVILAENQGIKVQRTEIYAILYRYFQYGCRSNAFLRKPGTGKTCDKMYIGKTGPVRSEGLISNGRMRTAKDNKNIEAILNKHVRVRAPKSLPKAYVELLDSYYSDPVYNTYSEVSEYKHWDVKLSISYQQFINHAEPYIKKNKKSFLTAQGKKDSFNKDIVGLGGTFKEYFGEGPGNHYQIDETPLDIELVCEFDPTRQRRVGKPTCYSVIDTYSSAWVGLLLTMNKSSAHTASEIMYIAMTDKKKFCKDIGIELIESWPMEGQCRSIIVDNAEFASELERTFSKDAQIDQVYNTEGNSQQKGMVERRHKSIEDFLYGMVPGVGRKKIADYLKRNLRKDALINRKELYQILVDFITNYNNYWPNTNLQLTKEMRSEGVKQIATEIWNWGIKNRAGFLKPIDESELYVNLLEMGEVTVYRDHLFLKGSFFSKNKNMKSSNGMKYTCEWTLKNGLQDKQKGRSHPRLACRFMRYSLNRILIETHEGFQVAKLHADEIMFADMAIEDIQHEKNKLACEVKEQKTIHDQKQSRTRARAKNIIKNASKEKTPCNAHQANTQDLSENRKITTEYENQKSAQSHERHFDKQYPESSGGEAAKYEGLASSHQTDEVVSQTVSTFREKRLKQKNNRKKRD